MKLLIAIVGAGCLWATPLTARDLSGIWMGVIPGAENRPAADVAFRFDQAGERLGGKLYGDFRDADSSPIIEGCFDGDQLRFVVERREQIGNLVHIVRYHYDGVVLDNGIELTSEKASARDAVTGAPAAVRRPDDTPEEDRKRRFRKFRLERLY